MTSRRSMLKWIPAACVGGWAGLFGKAAAAATAGAKPIGLQCEYDCAPNSGGTVDSYSSVLHAGIFLDLSRYSLVYVHFWRGFGSYVARATGLRF